MMRGLARTLGRAAVEGASRLADRVQQPRSLPVDLLEGEAEYLAVMDAPGVEHSDVQVRFVDDELLVRVDRFRSHYEGLEMLDPGRGMTLEGRVRLPPDAGIEPREAEAHLTDRGTLEVHLPKRAVRRGADPDDRGFGRGGGEGSTEAEPPETGEDDEGPPTDRPAT